MQEDISQLTDSELSQSSLPLSFLIPWYYCDICPRYRHYRSKIYSIVPIIVVLLWYRGLPRYYLVPITMQLSCG